MSLVLMVDRRRERAARALASLLRQTILDRLEIVLLDFGGPAVAPVPGADHPRVRLIRLRRGLPYGFAKLIGFRAARAPVVGFLEEHCRYAPRWAEAILAEFHDCTVGAVCGEMHNARPARWMSDAISVATAGPWTAPARSGPALALASNNSAYRRELLDRWEQDLDRLLGVEPLLQARVRAAGSQLRIVAEAPFEHEFPVVLSDYLAPRFLHDWTFAATMAELDGWRWP
jgi:glycosyltransferase involved in cell wall biosynthesis